MKQPEKSLNHLKENEAAKIGNNDNAENVNSLQQTLRETGRILVNDLSEKEIEYICMKITPRKIRVYFQRHPQEFNKIRPGSRAASLSDDMTVMLVRKNIAKDFIASFITKQLDVWRLEIEKYQKMQEEKGESRSIALLETIFQSVFRENVGLFFKVTGEPCYKEYIALMEAALQLLNEKKKREEISIETLKSETEEGVKRGEITELKEKVKNLTAQKVKLEQEAETEKELYFKAQTSLSKLSERNSELESEVMLIKKQIEQEREKEERLQAELDKYRKLSKYCDEETEEQREDYQHTSICQIFTDYNGKKCRRLADIEDRRINRFIKIEEEPPYFGNRDKLPLLDGPDTEEFVGIWNWSVIPNYKDSNRDYVNKMQYNSNLKYIEVVEFTECHSYEELLERLIDKNLSCISGSKVLFVYQTVENQMNGLLCGTRELEFCNGYARLKKNVYILPQYTIDSGDVIEIAGKKIYRYLNIGMPQNILQVKSPLEVVKEIVVRRATSARLRQGGLSIKETQHCQAFLKELPEKTMYQEIIDAYECTEKEAEEYLSAFIKQADSYLSENDIDMETLGAAVERNAELVRRCKELLLEDWQKENSEKLLMAQEELEKVQRAAREERDNYITYKEQHTKVQEELKELQAEISKQEKLAQDVQEKIAARIALARKDASDFISEMAFAMPIDTKSKSALSEGSSTSITYRKKKYHLGTEITDMDSFEEELTENLILSGYDERTALQMAQIIVFAICNNMPIACGEHAERIADCISSMFGCDGTCMISLPIGEPRCKEICDFIGQEIKDVNRVFMVNGIFEGFSLSAFHEIRQRSEEWGNKAILIFPLNGVNIEMISSHVWNQTMFIDGDLGITDFGMDTLNAFHSSVDFALEYDIEVFRKKRKLLKQFYGLIDNMAILNYAKYLAVTDGTMETDEMIFIQVLLSAKSFGKKEDFLEKLSVVGLDIKSNRYIKKYL